MYSGDANGVYKKDPSKLFTLEEKRQIEYHKANKYFGGRSKKELR